MAGWMSLTGDPAGPPDEERPVARRLLRRLRRGDRDARRHLARAPRRRGRRLRRLALRDRPRRAHLRRHVGRHARVLAPRRANTAHPSIVPFQTFATADGGSSIAASKQSFWERSVHAIERPELRRRSRASRASRRATSTATRSLADLDAVFAARPSSAMGRAARRRAASRSRRVNDVARRSRTRRTSRATASWEYEHPNLGTVRQVASPLRMSDAERPSRARAVPRRAHRGRPARAVRLQRRADRRAARGRRVRRSRSPTRRRPPRSSSVGRASGLVAARSGGAPKRDVSAPPPTHRLEWSLEACLSAPHLRRTGQAVFGKEAHGFPSQKPRTRPRPPAASLTEKMLRLDQAIDRQQPGSPKRLDLLRQQANLSDQREALISNRL